MTYQDGFMILQNGYMGQEEDIGLIWRGLNNTAEGVYGMTEGLMTYQDEFMTLQNGCMGQEEDIGLIWRVLNNTSERVYGMIEGCS